ncbi:MAG: sigma-70 family RNA polymerase sigma factor [Cytophagales bacterium]|nr:sigma-70 family RNA polymerase sigma factor [Cytophagales bacterium]
MQFQIYRARETELIEGCRRNDPSAQKALYDQLAPKMMAVCLRYVKDRMEAEDVLVTSFLKVFDRIVQFKATGSFEGWIRKIVVNESLTFLRKHKNMYLETDLEAAEKEIEIQAASHALEADDLLKLVAELPTGYRIVFNLYAVEGYSHKEIAEQIGITEGTSKSQLSRARSLLQSKIAMMERNAYPKQNKL